MKSIHVVPSRPWRPPALAALRALEASARLGSFTRAATELSVSQSAVSHAIAGLERHLGHALFDRVPGGLELTAAGRRYLAHVVDALASLRAAEQALRPARGRERQLTVSVSPSFAAKWLAPRLSAFATANPDLDLRISANPQHIDFDDGEVDLAVRHGDGHWPGLEAVRLAEETLFPACAPELARRLKLRSPRDLAAAPLLHHRDIDAWRAWFVAAGLRSAARRLAGAQFNEMSLVIDAAVAGQGVALVRSALAARDLASGRLVRPLPLSIAAPYAYWIVCPPGNSTLAKVRRFREWLAAEAAADRM